MHPLGDWTNDDGTPRLSLVVDDERVRCLLGNQVVWTIDLDSVVVVGERNVPARFFEEEHFLVLVTASDTHCEIPRDCARFDELVAELQRRFGEPLDFEMTFDGTPEGQVLLPRALRGQALFVIEPVRADGVLGWLASKLDPEYRERVADDVREFARSTGRRSAAATIDWLGAEEGGREELPTAATHTTVAKFEKLADRWPREAWSVVLTFHVPPNARRGATVSIRMLVEDAPKELLEVGSRFELYEGRRIVARGVVVEARR